MSPATVVAIFDDAGAATGDVNEAAVRAVLVRAETQVYSYIARNYPALTLPTTDDPAPESLRAIALEFAIVYSRDRKPEYWAKAQEGERQARIKGAFEMAERYASARQIAFDTVQKKPSNVGGIVYSAGPRTISDDADGSSNNGDF